MSQNLAVNIVTVFLVLMSCCLYFDLLSLSLLVFLDECTIPQWGKKGYLLRSK